MVRSADRSPPPSMLLPALIALVLDTALIPKENVTAPVEPETNMGVVAEVEETKELPSEFCLLLKVVQSAPERKPLTPEAEVAMVKVQFPVEEEMVMPERPEVAKEPAKYMVRSDERSPPPARAVPALIALDDETALMPRDIVRSADKSPPPKRGAVVLMARVDETAVIPKENVAVFAL